MSLLEPPLSPPSDALAPPIKLPLCMLELPAESPSALCMLLELCMGAKAWGRNVCRDEVPALFETVSGAVSAMLRGTEVCRAEFPALLETVSDMGVNVRWDDLPVLLETVLARDMHWGMNACRDERPVLFPTVSGTSATYSISGTLESAAFATEKTFLGGAGSDCRGSVSISSSCMLCMLAYALASPPRSSMVPGGTPCMLGMLSSALAPPAASRVTIDGEGDASPKVLLANIEYSRVLLLLGPPDILCICRPGAWGGAPWLVPRVKGGRLTAAGV